MRFLRSIWFYLIAPFTTKEQQFDYQLKQQFKPKNFPNKAICNKCKVEIENPNGYWVDGNGNVEYECENCEKEKQWLKLNTCNSCKRNFKDNELKFKINGNFLGSRLECSECHLKALENGKEIKCSICNGVYDAELYYKCPFCEN